MSYVTISPRSLIEQGEFRLSQGNGVLYTKASPRSHVRQTAHFDLIYTHSCTPTHMQKEIITVLFT